MVKASLAFTSLRRRRWTRPRSRRNGCCKVSVDGTESGWSQDKSNERWEVLGAASAGVGSAFFGVVTGGFAITGPLAARLTYIGQIIVNPTSAHLSLRRRVGLCSEAEVSCREHLHLQSALL